MAEPVDDNQEHVLEEAVHKFLDARSQGLEPDKDEFVKQYPGLEDLIRRRIVNLHKIDTLFDSLVQADERDFDGNSPEPDLVGQNIGDFEIVEMIGRGGMGVVYLARDTKLNRSVAIKSLPADQAGDSKSRMRFRREAKLLASLNHSNIAVIHDIIEQADGSACLILEYIPGETLAQRLARERLELEEALSIGRQITDAVAAAHEKGVVHRDLKPGNIKITPDGKAKVLDFGLAKSAVEKEGEKEITVTQAGHVIGTPAYMSPEQARGKPADHRTDIWSFGCIMFEMLAGRLPFEGETATETLAQIIECEPDWAVLPKGTPPSIHTLLRQCLEKDVDRRLGNMAEISAELGNVGSMGATTCLATSAVRSRFKAVVVALAIIISISSIVALLFREGKTPPSSGGVKLIVLPFVNNGPASDEDLVDGITDELIKRLNCLDGMSVKGRHTAMHYKKTDKQIWEIAEEMNVDYVLVGTLLRKEPSDPNSPMTIEVELSKAADGTLVWPGTYAVDDMGDFFRRQSEIAEQVARKLDFDLLEPKRRALYTWSTENVEAWRYYQRGFEHYSRGYQEADNVLGEIEMLKEAIKLDDEFALAHAKLSKAHSGMYRFEHDSTQARLVEALKEARRAKALDPEMPEADWALGFYYYWGFSDCKTGIEHFETAIESQPNNPEFIRAIAYAQRWSGKFEEALENIMRADELDPLFATMVAEVGRMHSFTRRYADAEKYFDRAIELLPNWDSAYRWKAQWYLISEGNTKNARDVLDEALQNVAPKYRRSFHYLLVNVDIYDEDYDGALKRLDSFVNREFMAFEDALRHASIRRYMKDPEPESEKRYYKLALKIIEEKILPRVKPADARRRSFAYSSLGIAYAGLDRKDDAISAGKEAVKIMRKTSDARTVLKRQEDLARIYAMVGDPNSAMDVIVPLLQNPGELSVHMLKIDPAWHPLKGNSRFDRLIESVEQSHRGRDALERRRIPSLWKAQD